ncbi:MAG: oxidoreductase [Gammaproteobacteria bacterium]|nr:MAG: oxidoreductase [Gammaproteobacteria bacterium]
MSELIDLCYARLGCPDLEQMVDFGTRLLGLELYERGDDWVFLRADDRSHNLCLFQGELADETVGFEVDSEARLQKLEESARDRGCEVLIGSDAEAAQRRVNAFVTIVDPSGTRIELAVGPQRTGRRYFPSRDAGITEFGHFGLHASQPEASLQFWTELLGARLSDAIGPAALLRIDDVHHKVALFPSPGVGIQHINFQVASVDDIMRSWYFLQAEGVPIVFGPGRHPTSTAIFLYFRGPDGRVYEYSCGVKVIPDDEAHTPRYFESKPSSFCMWGAKPQIAEFVE